MDQDITSSEVKNKEEVVPIPELHKELLKDFINRELNNTSVKLESLSDSNNNILITDNEWFDVGQAFKGKAKLKIDTRRLNEFLTVQKWQGVVKRINDESFIATVIDQTTGLEKEGSVDFDFEEVDQGDIDLIQEGAIFYWSVGFQYANGVRSKSSLIRFSRAPKWSPKEIKSFEAKGREHLERLERLSKK